MSESNYKTEQRDFILQCFKRNIDKMLTAAEIVYDVSAHNGKISQATIYRNLEHLEKQGLIKRFIDDDGKKSCYQYTGGKEKCTDHYHLKCVKCGKIIHLECEIVDSLDKHILSEHAFIMDRSKTIFYGLCINCTNE